MARSLFAILAGIVAASAVTSFFTVILFPLFLPEFRSLPEPLRSGKFVAALVLANTTMVLVASYVTTSIAHKAKYIHGLISGGVLSGMAIMVAYLPNAGIGSNDERWAYFATLILMPLGICIGTCIAAGRRSGRPWTHTTSDGKPIRVNTSPSNRLESVFVFSVGIASILNCGLPFLVARFPLNLSFWFLMNAGLAVVCVRQATRLTTQRVAPISRGILYLRAFDEDEDEVRFEAAWHFGFLHLLMGSREQRITRPFQQYGQVITVGRPGDRLPPLGANRIYVDDDNWQVIVEDLLKRSRGVLFRAGTTDGLRWELSKVLQLVAPKDLVILPPTDGYSRFQEWTKSMLPKPLPRYLGDVCAVCFDAEWTPIPVVRRRVTRYGEVATVDHQFGDALTELATDTALLRRKRQLTLVSFAAIATLWILWTTAILICVSFVRFFSGRL